LISHHAAFVPHSRAPARQGELISGRSLVFITPTKEKNAERFRKNGFAGLGHVKTLKG